MPVRVDQAGHQHAPAALDDLRTVRRGGIPVGDVHDLVAVDEQTKSVAQTAGSAVEQSEIREHDRPGWCGRLGAYASR